MGTILTNLKTILLMVLIGLVIWFYKDYTFQKEENIRQTENLNQLRQFDSIRFRTEILTSKELNSYLDMENKDLKNKLNADRINTKRIQSLISNQNTYLDSISKNFDLNDVKNAILNQTNIKKPFKDSTSCMQIKGNILFDGKDLKMEILERTYSNKNDVVIYWQRKQWKFLFIKSRLFGKKEFINKMYNDCGNSTSVRIEKKD